MEITNNFKSLIKSRLIERNELDAQISADIIIDYNFLLNRFVAVNKQVDELRYENDRLKSSPFSGNVNDQAVSRRIYDIQEELTNAVKGKAALDIKILELKLACNSKDKEIQELKQQVNSCRDQIMKQEELNRSNGESIKKLEDVKRTLTDEISANLLVYRSLDNKYRMLEESNLTLKETIKSLQQTLENKKNEEFDKKFKDNQDAVKRSLIEAASSSIDINFGSQTSGPAGLNINTVPTRVIQRFDAHDGEMGAVRFSPCGQILATSGSDRKIKIWTYTSGNYEYKATLTGCNGSVIAVDFEPSSHNSGKSLLLGCSTLDSSCRIWSLADCRMQLSLTGHTNKVVAGRFLGGSDNRVVTGSTDRTLKLWDCRTRCCVKTMLAMSACHDLVVSHSLGLIASGHFDRKLRLWDSRGGDLATDQLVLGGRITGLDLRHHSVVAATKDECLQTVDLRMLQLLQTYTAPHFKPGADLVRPCFSSCGQFVAAGSHDGSVYVWSTRTGKLEKTLSKEHSSLVIAVHWNPEMNILASCERNKRIVLYGD